MVNLEEFVLIFMALPQQMVALYLFNDADRFTLRYYYICKKNVKPGKGVLCGQNYQIPRHLASGPVVTNCLSKPI